MSAFFIFFISTVVFAVEARELDGLWRQDCFRGYQREEWIEGNKAAYSETNFRDLACTSPALNIVSRGELVEGGFVLKPLGARELDFIFSSVSLIPLDQGAADFYESISLCGLNGWKVKEEKEITGLSCEFFGEGSRFQIPKAGTRKFGIFRRGGDRELYFGKLSPARDASSPLKRPVEFDPLPYLRVHKR